MEKVFGKKITELKFFGFEYFDYKGTKHLIARSGWSKQGGFEVYVENISSGQDLYDHLFEIGVEFDVKPGCPNLIERIEKQGVTAYTVYNHMLLPAAFGSIEESCVHLKKDVQIWDVAAERQVEISGPDSAKLVQLMTCRDLSKSKLEDVITVR